MKNISKPIVFFGTDNFSVNSLEVLIESGFDVVAVVTKSDSKSGRGKKLTPTPIKLVAQKAGIPVWQPEKVSEISKNIKKLGSPIGVLVSYGKLIPQDILDLFNPGIVNLHPSLLPSYRGPSPIESAILNGDKMTGISLMQLTSEMDAGPVYCQAEVKIPSDERASELYEIMSFTGAIKLKQMLPDIIDGKLQPTPQNENDATYCKLIEKGSGIIDWNKPALQLEREVRAYYGWPRSRTKLGLTEVVITKAHVSEGKGQPGSIMTSNQQLGVYTSDGVLIVDSLIPAGKKEMSVLEFLVGYKTKIIAQ